MGNFNLNTPSARGMETRYAWAWNAPDWTRDLKGQQMRIRPTATTIVAVTACLPVVKGAPGFAVEIVDTQQPEATYTDFFPGTDTGATTTNLQDQGGAALNFGDIDDMYDANYARNSVALSSNQSATMQFRGNNAGALAGRRILRVQIGAVMQNRRSGAAAITGNATSIPVQGALVLNGVTYKGNVRSVPKADSFQWLPDVGDWFLSPATGLPWVVADVDDIIDAADADTFGLTFFGKADNNMVRAKMFLRVWHCLENRRGFLYQRGTPRRGWDRYVLGTTSAVSANTYYWVAISALSSSLQDYFSLGYVYPMEGLPGNDATVATEDARETSSVLLSGPGGIAQAGTEKISTGQTHFAALVEDGGTIMAVSQPYARVDYKDRYSGATANVGQQITSDAAQPAGGYPGITALIGWQDPNTRPDKPLIVEVRGGVGAISGGGALLATGRLQPEAMVQGDPTDTFVKFDTAWTPANATQYHVFLFSVASAGSGWRLPRCDTRTDLVLSGSGTSAANVQSAGAGTATDSYVEAGAANARYDLPLALTAVPASQTPTVVEYPAEPASGPGQCQSSLPPRLKATWPATALGSAFGAYHIWVRRHATPAELPILIANIDVPTGYTAATVEAQHREHWLYELGWSVLGAGYADGWDLGFSVVNATNGLESLITWTQIANQPDAASASWICSDAAPWLNTPLITQRDADSDPLSDHHVYPEVAGRDHAVVRVSGSVPGRRYKLKWERLTDTDYYWPDESILRGPRAAAISGRQMALLRVRGDKAHGALSEPTTSVTSGGLSAEADFVTTGADPALANANMPPGYVLNGATQFFSAPNNGLFRPAGAAFTIVLMAAFPSENTVQMDCGPTGASNDEYGFYSTGADGMHLYLKGTTAAKDVFQAGGATLWNDGVPHVAIGVATSAAGPYSLWRDETRVAQLTGAAGSISPATFFVVGANVALTQFSAMNPVHAWAYYPRALTSGEVVQTTRYLKGHAGYRMPAGAVLFVDLRDARCYGHTNFVSDLSGNGLDFTLTNSPTLRGIPWQIRDLERKR